MRKVMICCLTFLMFSCGQTSSDNKTKENETPLANEEQVPKEQKLQEEKPKTEEEIISDIREKFGDVKSNVNSYKLVKKDLSGESAEGGELDAYFKGDELKKLVASYYGEMGKFIEEYYFFDNQLFFVLTKKYSYDKPGHMDDSKVDSIEENRYYISNDKIIRWLNPKKEQVAKSEFPQKITEILQNAEELKEKLNKTNEQ